MSENQFQNIANEHKPNIIFIKNAIDYYYSENHDRVFPSLIGRPRIFDRFPFPTKFNTTFRGEYASTIDIIIPYLSTIQTVTIPLAYFSMIQSYAQIIQKSYQQTHNTNSGAGSDLEHVIQFGCLSFTPLNDGEIYEEKNKPLFYSDLELKYCIRKYGSWKVFKARFKYNFRRKLHFCGWWVCNLFGLKLYSKNEVTAAVYDACKVLRENLAPGECLEDKILQQIEKNESVLSERKPEIRRFAVSTRNSTLNLIPIESNPFSIGASSSPFKDDLMEINQKQRQTMRQVRNIMQEIESSSEEKPVKKIDRCRDF